MQYIIPMKYFQLKCDIDNNNKEKKILNNK